MNLSVIASDEETGPTKTVSHFGIQVKSTEEVVAIRERLQAAGLFIALAIVVADFVAYGTGWAPPLGWGVFIFTAFFFGLIGCAFLVAAALAVPG